MTDTRGPRGERWVLIGIAVVLAAAGGWVVTHRSQANPPTAEPTPAHSSATTSVPPRANCRPEIVDSGTANHNSGHFGFVYRSTCNQVVRLLRFRVTPQDASGKPIEDIPKVTVTGGVLFPSTELGVADTFNVPQGRKVAKVGVEVVRYQDFPASDFRAWAQSEVTDLKKGTPDSAGGYEVTGTLRSNPSTAPICLSEFMLIMRDKSGKIVWTDRLPAANQTRPLPIFEVPDPVGADLAHSRIYAPQLPYVSQPVPGTTCNGAG